MFASSSLHLVCLFTPKPVCPGVGGSGSLSVYSGRDLRSLVHTQTGVCSETFPARVSPGFAVDGCQRIGDALKMSVSHDPSD